MSNAELLATVIEALQHIERLEKSLGSSKGIRAAKHALQEVARRLLKEEKP